MKRNLYSGIRTIIVFSVMATMPGYALASGLGWLGDAPIRYFSEVDTRLMMDSLNTALDNNEDGVVTEWKNPETGHFGSIKPLATKEIDGLTCRKVEVVNEAKGRNAKSSYVLCKQPDGSWKSFSQ